MTDTCPSVAKTTPDGRTQRLLLGALFSLSVADGQVTRFIITAGLGREGNSFLRELAASDALIAVKIVGTLLAIYLLWQLYSRQPGTIQGITTILVACYTLIVWWNVLVVVVAI